MIVICMQCGKEFKKRYGNYTANKYCGRKCYGKSRGNKDFWNTSTDLQQLEHLRLYFNKYVIRKEGCWDWSGNLKGAGYGRLVWKNNIIGAHRASWMLHHGNILDDLWVLHKCDNPKCTNPEHLFLGTSKDNTQDMINKTRGSVGLIGELNHKAKLTIDNVREIRLLGASCKTIDLARRFNISVCQVCNIKSNKSWRDI